MYLIAVDTLPQCSIKDATCMKGVFQHIIKTVGSKRVEEMGIPPLDPIEMGKVSADVIKGVAITITQGTAKGMSNCVFNSFK